MNPVVNNVIINDIYSDLLDKNPNELALITQAEACFHIDIDPVQKQCKLIPKNITNSSSTASTSDFQKWDVKCVLTNPAAKFFII